MRTGTPTLHQALTPEAATILKLSLSLAQRRNHAQVTPLHVATTLLTTTSGTSPPSLCTPTNLLKRACLKSQHQPHQPNYQNTLLHCRALELCFNVALNRLPTCTSSPSSSSSTANGANPNPNSLMHASTYPTLSNALIAALKRAQANQRRGCIELQQQQQQNQLQQSQNQNQNQQPLLAIKVELEQLIISILDDPSVSRVMREAGFSSSLVKSSLEEEREKECSVLSLGQNKDHLWQTQFMIKPSVFDHQDPLGIIKSSSQIKEEDVRMVLEVMGRKKNKRSNPVLVGDSVSLTESLVEEIKRRLERGDVPEELKGVQFVKLGMSILVGKEQIQAKMEEIKRNLMSSSSSTNGVVVYVGDLKWAALVEEDESLESGLISSSVVEEIERLVQCTSTGTGTSTGGNKLWVLGIASYQSYMQVKRRRPSLELKWGLHAVTVPCGTGLSLSLQAPAQSGMEPRVARLNQSSYQLFEAPAKSYFAPKEEREEEREMCFECNANYEREASIILNTDSRGTGGIQMPSWLRPNRPVTHHKVNLMELRSKWSRLCQKLHQFKNNSSQFYPSFLGSGFNPKNLNLLHPIWGPCSQNKPMFDQLHAAPFQSNCPKTWPLEASRDKEIKITNSSTNLFLGGLFNLSDSATSESKESRKRSLVEVQELEKRLNENIPWQPGAISSIVEAFEKRENVILLEGNDQIAKRRVALIVAETYCGSSDKVIRVDPFKFDLETVSKEVEKERSCVVLVEGINQAPTELHNLVGCLKDQSDAIIILTSSRSDTMLKGKCPGDTHGAVNLRFSVEFPSDNDLKRKSPSENELEREPKRHRGETGLDLNLCAFDDDEGEAVFDEEEVIPSDITHEDDGFDNDRRHIDLPQSLYQKIGARISIGGGSDSSANVSSRILARLNRACANAKDQSGDFSVDKEVIEWLVWAYSSCLEPLFEKWVREVFQICVPTVKKGGKVRLVLGGGIEGSQGGIVVVPGFCGSVLPEKIQLD